MAFYPFPFTPVDHMEAMQNSFRQADLHVRPFVAMGMPMMAQAQASSNCYRPPPPFNRQQARASSSHEDDIFHIDLDVQHFLPEEISVKTVDDHVVIEGKHEEKEFGSVSAARHFCHKYSIPQGVKFEDITSSLSSDGILTVSVPKTQSKKGTNECIIPITPTGLPAKAPAADGPSSSKGSGESKE